VDGFHLLVASPEYLATVMAELRKFDFEHVMPMYCGGLEVDMAGMPSVFALRPRTLK
jgi:metal-dependent hydrolase (beta-lactamase superfamily II)